MVCHECFNIKSNDYKLLRKGVLTRPDNSGIFLSKRKISFQGIGGQKSTILL